MSYLLLLFLFTYVRSAEELAPIEVTTGKELSEFHLGSSSKVEIRDSNLVTESIEKTPGVVSSQNGGPGGRVTYFIRGTEARHVSFTLDHLKLNDPSNTDRQFDAAFLSSSFIKEMTLYKGPQAVLFGSDAMGGLLDMRSRKGENPGETRASLSAGSFGTLSSSLSHDHKSGTFTVSTMRTDGISRLNKKRFNAKERDAADTTQVTSSTRHRWSKGETDLLLSFLRGNNELDGNMADNSVDKSRNDQYMLQQKTSHGSGLSFRNGISRHQRNIKTQAVGNESYSGDLIQNELLYNHEYGLVGFAREDEKSLDKTANLNSAFVQTHWKESGWHLQGGMRLERHSRFGNFETGAAGIGKGEFAIQYSQGFKAPSIYQLYGPPIFGFPVGNKNLVPERNHSWEAVWKHKDSFEIAFFQNRLNNLITFSNQGYANQGSFIAQGIETSADLKLRHLRFRPGFVYQEFKDEESPVIRRPNHLLTLETAYFVHDSWEIFATPRFSGARKDLNTEGEIVKLNGYETLDLGTRFYFKQSEWGIQLVNIFDREYEDLYGYSVMPRSVFTSFKTKFQ